MSNNQSIKVFIFSSFLSSILFPVFGQSKITIDHKTQRYIGNISKLDRSKFTNGHFSNTKSDPDFDAFKTTYNIPSSYKGSRGFWNPFSQVKNGVIPNVKNKTDGVRNINKGFVATGKEKNLFHNTTLDYSAEDISEFSKQSADYIARKYRDDWNGVPNYIEPLNEPMVHAVDHYPEGRLVPRKYVKAKTDKVITKICEFHRDIGKAIHGTPELVNMKVMGFASAFPEFESKGFGTWNDRYKKFIDIAGEDVDVFSVHLYDGSGLNNAGGRRSGSNAEAILDMVEAYSFIKLNKVKPIAVTEYGRLVPDQEGWTATNGANNFESVTNSQAVRSQIHMVMNFMEREDLLEVAIPFNVNTRNTTVKFSKSSIWINRNGSVELSERRFFYEILKDLKGERVRINSSNIDVQSLAFVEGNQLFVMLNNLNNETQTVDLDLLEKTDLQNVGIKRLKIFTDKVPELIETVETTIPESIELAYGETIVLTYNFDSPITFDNTIVSKKYYATEYLKSITANTNNVFNFNNIEVGDGEATLRLGVARAHGKLLSPIVSVNGNNITIDKDIIRGHAQPNRKQFFGTLEIPVPMDVLNEGNNSVDVKFTDGGGQISSVILQVQKSDKPLPSLSTKDVEKNEEFFIFDKNPVKSGDKVTISSLNNKDVEVTLFTTEGKIVLRQSGNVIDTKGLVAGIYLVTVRGEKQVWNSKLIVE